MYVYVCISHEGYILWSKPVPQQMYYKASTLPVQFSILLSNQLQHRLRCTLWSKQFRNKA